MSQVPGLLIWLYIIQRTSKVFKKFIHSLIHLPQLSSLLSPRTCTHCLVLLSTLPHFPFLTAYRPSVVPSVSSISINTYIFWVVKPIVFQLLLHNYVEQTWWQQVFKTSYTHMFCQSATCIHLNQRKVLYTSKWDQMTVSCLYMKWNGVD